MQICRYVPGVVVVLWHMKVELALGDFVAHHLHQIPSPDQMG